MNDRTKSILYTISFWGGLVVASTGAVLIGLAGSIGEYLAAYGVMAIAGLIWLGAHKLNPKDVEEFMQHTSWNGKKRGERSETEHDI